MTVDRALLLLPSGVCPIVTTLPEATREAQIKRWRLQGRRYGLKRWTDRKRRAEASRSSADGYHVVNFGSNNRPGSAGGLTSHRGVLHPDEYVDLDALRRMVETMIGFTCAQIRGVYRRGRLAPEDLALRSRIDASMLEVAQSCGLNVAEFGRAVGLHITRDGHCRTITNALARARSRPRSFTADDPRVEGIRADARASVAAVVNEMVGLADGDGLAPFRKRHIAARTGLSESTVYRAIRHAERCGLVGRHSPSLPLGPGRGASPAVYALAGPTSARPRSK